MKKSIIVHIFLVLVLKLNAHDSIITKSDSVTISSGTEQLHTDYINSDLFKSVTDSTSEKLLPDHFLFTQRIFWGKNGLCRKLGWFPLTVEGREREMEIRAVNTKIHKATGYLALASILGAGITGQMAYKGNEQAAEIHGVFTTVAGISYGTSLAFKLFCPPPMKDRESGLTKLNLHRALSIVHLTSMVTTFILAGELEDNPSMVPYHRAAAITAFSSLLAATVIINF